MSHQREIFDDAITTHLENIINANNDAMRILWKEYHPDETNSEYGKDMVVYRSMQDQLPNPINPIVEIIQRNRHTEIISIGTQDDTYNYDLLITVTNNHPVFSDQYLRIIGQAMQTLLNDFNNRSFEVPGYNFCTYYSEAGDVDFGFRRGKGLKTARLPWYCKVRKPNRF
jgi:hypothetical protein